MDGLLRLMVYSRLFVIEAPSSRTRDSMMSAMSGSSSSTGCTPPPSMKRMISDLEQSHIWQLEDIWLKIAKCRANWIQEGVTSAKSPSTTTTPTTGEQKGEPAVLDKNGKVVQTKSEWLMLVEDVTADMRRTGQPTQDIVLFIKFLTSAHCEVIPPEVRKADTLDSQMFQKGCADLIEMFDKQTFSGRNSLMSNKSLKEQ